MTVRHSDTHRSHFTLVSARVKVFKQSKPSSINESTAASPVGPAAGVLVVVQAVTPRAPLHLIISDQRIYDRVAISKIQAQAPLALQATPSLATTRSIRVVLSTVIVGNFGTSGESEL